MMHANSPALADDLGFKAHFVRMSAHTFRSPGKCSMTYLYALSSRAHLISLLAVCLPILGLVPYGSNMYVGFAWSVNNDTSQMQ